MFTRKLDAINTTQAIFTIQFDFKMSLPQRHEPSKDEKPQTLAVPQEITDIIESHLDNKWHRRDSIKALRLTCRTFSEGLFTTFVKEYLKDITFYLNVKGAEDIEWLANSRLAPYVQTVKLADRQPSLAVLEYREVEEDKIEHNLAKFDEQIDRLLARENVDVGSPPAVEAFRESTTFCPARTSGTTASEILCTFLIIASAVIVTGQISMPRILAGT